MEIDLIQVGNSKGIRIPKKILEQYAMEGKLHMELAEEGILLKPVNQPRLGWGEAFAAMAAAGDDELLIQDVFEDENLDW